MKSRVVVMKSRVVVMTSRVAVTFCQIQVGFHKERWLRGQVGLVLAAPFGQCTWLHFHC